MGYGDWLGQLQGLHSYYQRGGRGRRGVETVCDKIKKARKLKRVSPVLQAFSSKPNVLRTVTEPSNQVTFGARNGRKDVPLTEIDKDGQHATEHRHTPARIADGFR